MDRAAQGPLVAIDLRIADAPGMERTGVGRYALETARAVAAARPGWRLQLHSNRPELLPAPARPASRASRLPTRSALGRIAWVHAGSALARPRPQAWFSPSFVLPLWWRGPSVVTIHDLSFVLMPQRYRGRLNAAYAGRAAKWSARHADRVLCGSGATRERLAHHLGVDPSKVVVTPYGVAETFLSAPGGPGDGDYVLFVGRFEARKGLEVLHRALREVNRAGDRLRLVLAGGPGWGADEAVAALQADPAVSVVLEPSDEELARLYRGALALAYPSRMEGFGLPVAEAMACGCPVIASDLPEIREWAGDAPWYVEAGDAGALASALGRVPFDPALRERMASRGRAVAAGLRWEVVGEAAAQAIEAALAAHGRAAASTSS